MLKLIKKLNCFSQTTAIQAHAPKVPTTVYIFGSPVHSGLLKPPYKHLHKRENLRTKLINHMTN